MMDKVRGLLRDREKMRELILYGVFGALTTAVNYGTFLLLHAAFGLSGIDPAEPRHKLLLSAATVAAWIVSVAFAFFTNRKYVFQSDATAKSDLAREALLFLSARVGSLLLFDVALLYATVYLLHIDERIAKLLMNVLVVIFNYAASKLIIFKKRPRA